MRTTFRKYAPARIALAILAALTAVDASATAGPALVAAPARLAHGDAILGALPMNTPMHVVVGLKLRDRTGLEAAVHAGAQAAVDGRAPHLLSRTDVLDQHAPTQAQAQAVADYLTARGFGNVTISPSRMLVSADGTAMVARDAFMTTFAQVRTADGRVAYANTTEARIPGLLADKVEAVLGLQTVHGPRSLARRQQPGTPHTMAVSGHYPTEFPTIYNVGTAAAATSVPVGIITEGKLTQVITDLNKFTDINGLPRVTTQTVNTGGTSTDTSGVGEWDLDSQNIVGMAGRVQKLVFYNMPNMYNSDLVANFDTAVTSNTVKIVNVSLGECELYAQPVAQGGDGSAAIADALFLVAAAQGQTFTVSTGDSGADNCGNGTNVASWPANSPYVVAVAGTRLNTTGTGAWSSESVWTNSGGSPSVYEPMPAWQSAFGVTGSKRGVADVAFDADPNSGSIIYVNGSLAQYGGTSLAAPLFAGLWARVRQARPSIGFAAPVLYTLPTSAFHDITKGRNSGGTAGVGYPATTGYDFASGRGSLMIRYAVSGSAGKTQQLLADTGFESAASTGWTLIPASVRANDASGAHSGVRYAALGGTASSTQRAEQTVTIPAGKTFAALRFYLKTTTAELGNTAKDSLRVQLCDASGNVLQTLATYWNRDATSGYVLKALDLGNHGGQTVIVRFLGKNDASAATSWNLDDVSLWVE